MSNGSAGTKTHILDITEDMLTECSSDMIHIVDVAARASVGIQTIYYHFGSIRGLIAETQMCVFGRLTEPLDAFLEAAEAAIVQDDEPTFWEAVGDDVMMAWSYGFVGDRWSIPQLLIDISAHPKTQRDLSDLLDVQFERWVNVIEGAKMRGWANPEVDTYALVAACWAAANGQAVLARNSRMEYTPERIRAFFLEIAVLKR